MNISANMLLKLELRDFYEEYNCCLDESEFHRWPDFFTEDALYRITGYENVQAGLAYGPINCFGIGMIRDRALTIRETTVYEPRRMRRFVSNVRVLDAGPEVIAAQTSFAVFETLLDRDPRVYMVGYTMDKLVRRNDALLLKERICVYDNDCILQGLVLPI